MYVFFHQLQVICVLSQNYNPVFCLCNCVFVFAFLYKTIENNNFDEFVYKKKVNIQN